LKNENILFLILCALMIIMINADAQTTGTLKDPRDGQIYKTVKIGDQWWMAQNLNYKTSDSFCYLLDSSFSKTYGRLYVYDDAKNACPAGWHLPDDAEWTKLSDYLGGSGIAGGKMKATNTGLWNYFDISDSNSSGFSALPGGCHSTDWEFGLMKFLGFWWTSTAYTDLSAWDRYMECGLTELSRADAKKMNGFSVRCVKD
jgi:uncharacterized protein (TIGR02145 family)